MLEIDSIEGEKLNIPLQENEYKFRAISRAFYSVLDAVGKYLRVKMFPEEHLGFFDDSLQRQDVLCQIQSLDSPSFPHESIDGLLYQTNKDIEGGKKRN